MYRSTKSKNEVQRVILHVTFILLKHNRVSLFFLSTMAYKKIRTNIKAGAISILLPGIINLIRVNIALVTSVH